MPLLDQIKGVIAGLRYDLSVVGKSILLLEILFLLLGGLTKKKPVYYIFCMASGVLMLAMIHIQLLSLFIFGMAERHVVFEYSEWFRHFGGVFREAVYSHGGLFFSAVALLIALAYAWYRLWKSFYQPERPRYKISSAWALIVLLWAVVLGRGGLQDIPLHNLFTIEDTASPQFSYLRQNSVFTLIRYYTVDNVTNYKFMPEHEAKKSLLLLTDSARMNSPNPDFPLMKQFKTFSPLNGKYNFVFLVMESWGTNLIASLATSGDKIDYLAGQAISSDLKEYISSLAENHPLKTGITPNFDMLAKDGLLFTNFYSNGTNSIEGLTSMMMSLPPMKDFSLFRSSFVKHRFSKVNSILQENDYFGLYLSGLWEGSGYFNLMMQLAGVDRVIEMPFFKITSPPDPWGLFDHITLEGLSLETTKLINPFFAYYISITTHSPYLLPEDWKPLLPEIVPNYAHLNELHYSDAALGKFFENEKASSHFSNTIYIITADHTSFVSSHDYAGYQKVPLLIYAPGIIAPGRNNLIGSHVDILPTIADIIGYQKPFTSAGRSLLDDTSELRYASILTGEGINWIQDGIRLHLLRDWKTYSAYQAETGEKLELSEEKAQAYIKNLKSYYQTINNSIISNSLMPPAISAGL